MPKLAKRPKGRPSTKTERKPASRQVKGARPPRETRPAEELVVFAFRLTPEEREEIHKAAGPAKASRFVRTLAVAAAKGDMGAIRSLLAQTPTN